MLKFIIVLSLLLSVIAAHHTSTSRRHYNHETSFQNPSSNEPEEDTVAIIKRNGYGVETYTVITSDGYYLDVFRIRPKFLNSENITQGSKPENEMRAAVLFMPGMESSSDDYIIGGHEQSFAFYLADLGLDIFLGNVRGSKYGRKHSSLDPDRDPSFWNFCWDDIAFNDLPTIIEFVHMNTKSDKFVYVGHMQGSTLFYALASRIPEYLSKMRFMITLGPLAYLGNTENYMFKLAAEKLNSRGWIARHFGLNEFKPSDEAMESGGKLDCLRWKDEKLCKNSYLLLNGYNSNHLNSTTIDNVVKNVEEHTGMSTNSILHYGQLVKNGRFTDKEGQDYNLGVITTPIMIVYTNRDMTSTTKDVEKLISSLVNIRRVLEITELSNNLDLLFANNVRDIVYEKIVHILKSELTGVFNY